MDDFDEERGAPGPAELAGVGNPPGAGGDALSWHVLRHDADREEVHHRLGDRTGAIRVRALSSAGQGAVRAELQLLAALEVAGVEAAPTVLEVEDDGYVREAALPRRPRAGRRAAPEGEPGTEERSARRRAREDLDALIDELHDRGWVLGAPFGEGLGMREDGTLMVCDLSGLRPGSGTPAQLDDRLWVDSVLRDQDRTLRRRIDQGGEAIARSGRPRPIATRAARGEPDRGQGPSSGAPRPGHGHGGGPGTETPPSAGPGVAEAPALGVPDVRRRRAGSRRRAGTERERGGGGSTAPDGRGRPGARVRRTMTVAAGLVLVALGMGLGFGTSPSSAPPPSAADGASVPAAPPAGAGEAGPSSTPDDVEQASPAEIIDPMELAAELARSRHAYLIGTSQVPAAGDGSPALEADDEIRAAYAELEVSGGEPVVHAAEVGTEPDAEGRARLRVETSTPAHEVTDADGTVRTVPASRAVVVELDLRWDGTAWLVHDTEPA